MSDSILFTKSNVDENEYTIQNFINRNNIIKVPKIYSYNTKTKILKMSRLPTLSIADMYGDDFNSIPNNIIEKIRENMKQLYKANINYPDITGYNFIEFGNEVYTIDFEHASFIETIADYDPFMLKFINGENSWNPEYL